MPRLVSAVCLSVLIVSLGGCSRPSSKILGRWQAIAVKDQSAYEFFKDGSILFYIRSDVNKGTWKFLDDGRLEVELPVMARAVRIFDVTFEGETAVFKSTNGTVEWLKKVSDFVSMNRAKDLMARGVDFWGAQAYQQALEPLREAADLGYAPAQTGIGNAYFAGKGVKQDYSAAIEWWKKAAAQGDSLAQNNLAWLYAACKDPNYQNGKKAVEYATRAVSQHQKIWFFVGTLSGAYARNGQFDEAITSVKQATELLWSYTGEITGSKEKWLARMAQMSESFKKHQPYTDTDSDIDN
jgi:tetratricopeptide (TPR) repeat protein